MQLEIIKKINFKKFFLISIVPTALSLLLVRNINEVFAILTIYLATVIYLFMFAEAVYRLTENQRANKNDAKKGKIAFFFIGKFAILVGALIFGVQIMGNRIIIPVLNYIILIFVLTYSTKSLDKGSKNEND